MSASPSVPPVPFWFLRHGETDWNARDLAQGNVEVPLNVAGIGQAHVAAGKLTGQGIVTIVSSPLQRAMATAQIVAEALGLEIAATDPDLREVSFGVKEGQPMEGWFRPWIDGAATPEGAEPFAGLRVRAVGAVSRALAFPGPVLVVAHGSLFRSLRSAMGLDPYVRWANAAPTRCLPPGPDGGPWQMEIH